MYTGELETGVKNDQTLVQMYFKVKPLIPSKDHLFTKAKDHVVIVSKDD